MRQLDFAAANLLGPAGEAVEKFEFGIICDGVRKVIAIDQAFEAFHDHFEEWVECLVLGGIWA